MSKLQTAIEIVKANSDKKAALELIQSTLGVTRTNASVYLFKANKALASQNPTQEPVVEIINTVVAETPAKEYTQDQTAEYNEAMAERVLRGLSPMTIDEYFEMSANLPDFA